MCTKMLHTLVSVIALSYQVEKVNALEVYRIGGEDEPRPNQIGVNFHQLLWSDFVDKQSLDEEFSQKEFTSD